MKAHSTCRTLCLIEFQCNTDMNWGSNHIFEHQNQLEMLHENRAATGEEVGA